MSQISLLLKYGLLYTAAAILLLHSWVPHQHHTTQVEEPTFTSCVHSDNSILGFLGRVFHQDLGSEHLENFQSVKKIDFSWQIDFIAEILTINSAEKPAVHGNNYQFPIDASRSDQSLVQAVSVRGPPFV